MADYNTAEQLWIQAANAYKSRPNGGPVIAVSDVGSVGDGYSLLAQFHTQGAALRTLKAAGFRVTAQYERTVHLKA